MVIGILDGQSIQALIFAKQIRNSGHKVILFCEEKMSYGYYTRFAHSKVISPSSKKDVKKYHDFIIEFLNQTHVDVLVPMNDYSAKYMSLYKSVLSKLVNISIPNYSVFMSGYDKNQLMRVCMNNGFPHPQTLDLEMNISSTEKIKFKFPALIKPNETTGARGFTLVNNFEELNKIYPEVKNKYGNCHLQQFIPFGGRQFKVQILINDKKILASSVIEKHRFYPVNGGSSCYNSSIINEELKYLCFQVLKEIHWQGFADFDLIEDPRDGSILIMEINPRVPACIKASVISGIDFPNAIVDLSLGKTVKKYKYLPGKFLRYFSMDVLWLIKSNNISKNLTIWFKKIFSKNHYMQDIDYSDPMPFIIGTLSGLIKHLNPEFRKQKKGMNS
jgi:D-aspartate ligase